MIQLTAQRGGLLLLFGARFMFVPSVSRAQSVPATVTPKDTAKRELLFLVSDARLLGGFLAGAAVARPLELTLSTPITLFLVPTFLVAVRYCDFRRVTAVAT